MELSVLSGSENLLSLKLENSFENTPESLQLYLFNNLVIKSSALDQFEVNDAIHIECTEYGRKLIHTSKTTLPKFGTTQNSLKIMARDNEYSLEVCRIN